MLWCPSLWARLTFFPWEAKKCHHESDKYCNYFKCNIEETFETQWPTLINSLVCWLCERERGHEASAGSPDHLDTPWISCFIFYFLSGQAHWIWLMACLVRLYRLLESIQRTARVLLLLFPSAEVDLAGGTSCLRGWMVIAPCLTVKIHAS